MSPESARWLFTQGRIEEGTNVLLKIAKMNRRPRPDLSNISTVLKKEMNEEKNRVLKYNYITLFKYQATRWKSVLLGAMW